MITIGDLAAWRGAEVVDSAGEPVGRLTEVYYEVNDKTPLLGLVKSGLFGRHSALVPLDNAAIERDFIRVAHTAEQVAAAAKFDSEELVSAESAAGLRETYGAQPGLDGRVLESATVIAEREEAEQTARIQADILTREAQVRTDAALDARERAHAAETDAHVAERQAAAARAAAADVSS